MPLIGRDTDYDDIHHNDNASKTNNDKLIGDEKDENNSITEGRVWYATGFAGHGPHNIGWKPSRQCDPRRAASQRRISSIPNLFSTMFVEWRSMFEDVRGNGVDGI